MPKIYPGIMPVEEFEALCETVSPNDPCPEPPGSASRVATYAMRYETGQPIFHPLDTDLETSVRLAARKQAAFDEFNPATDAELREDELEEPDDESDWE